MISTLEFGRKAIVTCLKVLSSELLRGVTVAPFGPVHRFVDHKIKIIRKPHVETYN
jgi:hypothetical protein